MPTENQPYFEIRTSPIQGRGAFATRRIRKGTRLIEYVGERISHAEADRRYDDDTMKRHHTFLFTLNNRTVIDAGVNGNEARFINHSCDPNCQAIEEDGRIFIEAIRNIQPGTELTDLYRILVSGVTGAAMPAWDPQVLPDKTRDVWALAYYVRSLIRMRGTEEGLAFKARLASTPANPKGPE